MINNLAARRLGIHLHVGMKNQNNNVQRLSTLNSRVLK